jgi:hypothetical protein
MRFKIKLFISISIITAALLLGNALVQALEQQVKGLPNVIIITLSGVRNQESVNDPDKQYLAYFWQHIVPQGSLYNNLIDLNYEFHMPTVQAINTGIPYAYPFPNLEHPSIFQYLRKRYSLDQEKLWMIGQWRKNACVFETEKFGQDTFPSQLIASKELYVPDSVKKLLTKPEQELLGDFDRVTYKSANGWPQWDGISPLQWDIFMRILNAYKPKFVHYVMNDIEGAHYGNFARYALALKRNDRQLQQIWKYIKEDDFYKNNTYLIVTVDHQRNPYYMSHHEMNFEDPEPVWAYFYGPKIKKNALIERQIHHIDIFATAAMLYDLTTHPTRAIVIEDCFDD